MTMRSWPRTECQDTLHLALDLVKHGVRIALGIDQDQRGRVVGAKPAGPFSAPAAAMKPARTWRWYSAGRSSMRSRAEPTRERAVSLGTSSTIVRSGSRPAVAT